MKNTRPLHHKDGTDRLIASSPRNTERGFTLLEGTVVVLLVGVAIALATPKVTNAMREHKLSSAVRDITDLIQQAKAKAMADNRNSSLVIDTEGRRMGLVVYKEDGTVERTDYVPLPDGVSFDKPLGNKSPMSGAPTTESVSFQKQGDVFRQDFNSRGFPVVATQGAVNALYLSNGEDFRAITMTSVGGIRAWYWEDDNWVAPRK